MATKLDYQPHPYAQLFPLDEGQPLWEMSDDIKLHGQRVPIVLYQDKVLDGRRRLLACKRAGVDPRYTKFAGGDDAALAFVVSHNLHRRHLGTGDRAMIAAKITTLKQSRAENSQKHGTNEAKTEGQNCTVSQKQAAEMLNVSERTVKSAAKVISNGTPELQQAVEDHAISVSDAAAVADEKPETQREAVAKVKKGKAKTAKAAVKGDADEGELEKFTDAEGLAVPADAVPAFQAAKDIEAVCRELNAIIKRVEAISKGPGGRLIRFPSFKQQVEDAKGNIWANRATHVCPYCKGTGNVKGKECEACKGECWVAKHIHAAAPGVTKHK